MKAAEIRESVIYIMKKLLAVFGFAVLMACIPVSGYAQYLRNSYFMEGSSARMSLNPALVPSRGYINLPVVGAFGLEVGSNSLGAQDVMDIMDDGGSFCSNDKFMGMLKDENTLGLDFNTDVFSVGYHTPKAFVSFGVAVKAQVDAIVPKSMFQYVYDLENDLFTGFREYNIRNERLNVNTYTELSFGYARQVGERLTIGGKAKMLLGYANIDLNVKKLDIEAYVLENKVDNVYPSSIIETDAQMALSGKGIELEYDANGCVDDVKMGEFGIGGYGAAVDFGLEFKVTDHMSLYASVVDLGFISWSKSASEIFTSTNAVHKYENPEADILDFETFALKGGVKKARKTSLAATVTAGGEYGFFNDKLSLGLLSVTSFGEYEKYSELMAIATFRPTSLFNVSASYSVLQGTDTFGLALKLGPLMVGTDYMFLSDNTKHVNAYFGLSIPLARK